MRTGLGYIVAGYANTPAQMPCHMQRRMKPKAVMQNHQCTKEKKSKVVEMLVWMQYCRFDVGPDSSVSHVDQLEERVHNTKSTDTVASL